MRNAVRYEELAQYARDHGFSRVKRDAVQQWVKQGLVPPASPIHYAFGRRTFVYPTSTGQQILEFCRIRFLEKVPHLDFIGLRLWFAGYAVSSEAVRRGLVHAADLSRFEDAGWLLSARSGNTSESPSAAVGTAAGALYGPLLTLGIVDRPKTAADVTVGLTDYVEVALGREPEGGSDPVGQQALGNLGGFSIDETAQLPSVARLWDPEHVRARIETATDGELLSARAAARIVGPGQSRAELPDIVRYVPSPGLDGLMAVALLVLRDYPLAAEVLEANASERSEGGANGLRYLR